MSGKAARPVASEPTGRGSAFGPLFFFCVGILAMKVAATLLAPGLEQIFLIAACAGIALSGALAYRRFVRRTIEARRRDRARREGRG